MQELINQGTSLYQDGKSREAIATFEQALVVAEQLRDKSSQANILNSIGVLHDSLAELKDALDYYNQALPLWQLPSESDGKATTLNNIGAVYSKLGNQRQALDYYSQALPLFQSVPDKDGEASVVNGMGLVYYDLGEPQQALSCYNRALPLFQAVPDKDGEAQTLNNLGVAYDRLGERQKALAYYNQALPLREAVGDFDGKANTLNNIGAVYDELGEPQQALAYYIQALPIFQMVDDSFLKANTLNNIGAVYDELGNQKQALDYYNQALQLRQAVGDRAGEAGSHTNIGVVYSEIGEQQQALDSFDQALPLQRAVGDRAGEATTLHNIGTVYFKLGDWQQALDYYNQALPLRIMVGDRAGEAATLANRAHSKDKLGDIDGAISDYSASMVVVEALLGFAALDSSVSSLKSQFAYTLPYQQLAVLRAQQGQVAAAFGFADRGRALLLRTELTQRPIDFRASASPELLSREHDLRTALSSAQLHVDTLHTKLLGDKDNVQANTDLPNAEKELAAASSAYLDHLDTMERQGGFLNRQLAFDTAPLSDIQQAIPPDTTLVLYAVGPKTFNSIAFLVTRTSLDFALLDVDETTLAAQVTAFTANRREATEPLSTLYTAFFAPLADKITTSHLIIVPDGLLNYIPFAALIAPDGSYLIDHYTISLVPSATSLVLLQDRKPTPSPSTPSPITPGLVLAQNHALGLPDLNFVRTEADAVATVLGVKPNFNATTADLRNGAAGSQVLHISAHAAPNSTAPFLGVIYLGEFGGDGGRFEVRNVYELDLSKGTDLVVLSGCQTASGGGLGGGEDFGVLVRAFFGAGAPRVVASLWSVDDEATAMLIKSYMKGRGAAGIVDADALRGAMLETRQSFPDPYYWASFVLVGQP